jgi:hypothetical protein
MRISSLTRGPSREGGVGGAGGLAMEVSYEGFENDGLEQVSVAMQSLWPALGRASHRNKQRNRQFYA